MSDFGSESDSESGLMERIGEEIKRKKRDPATRGMFVSGWDDPDADEGVREDPRTRDAPGGEALRAAEDGRADALAELLDADPALTAATDGDGYTPLHRAAYGDRRAAVDLLLSRGASTSAKTKTGWEPLHSACHWNHPACVARLLAAGADVAARSAGDQTPLHVAASVGRASRTLQLLLSHPDADPDVENRSGDRPRDIARRTGLLDRLFLALDPPVDRIRSKLHTANPFARTDVPLRPAPASPESVGGGDRATESRS